jgi:hypothetical protein
MRAIRPSAFIAERKSIPSLPIDKLPLDHQLRRLVRRVHLVRVAVLVGVVAGEHQAAVGAAVHAFDAQAVGRVYRIDLAAGDLGLGCVENDDVAVDDEVGHAVAVGVDGDHVVALDVEAGEPALFLDQRFFFQVLIVVEAAAAAAAGMHEADRACAGVAVVAGVDAHVRLIHADIAAAVAATCAALHISQAFVQPFKADVAGAGELAQGFRFRSLGAYAVEDAVDRRLRHAGGARKGALGNKAGGVHGGV